MSMAGTMAANTNQIGSGCDIPTGFINQSRLCGAVGDTPSGTSSFYKHTTINSFSGTIHVIQYSPTTLSIIT